MFYLLYLSRYGYQTKLGDERKSWRNLEERKTVFLPKDV